jgi:hypothetical protein
VAWRRLSDGVWPDPRTCDPNLRWQNPPIISLEFFTFPM